MNAVKFGQARLSRIIIPVLTYAFYALGAVNPMMAVITLPSFIAIMYFSMVEKDPYINENDIINALSLIFFVISPIQAIDKNGQFLPTLYVASVNINLYHVIIAELIFLLFYLVYMFNVQRLKRSINEIKFKIDDINLIFLFGLLVVAFFLHILAYGNIGNFFASRYQKNADDISFLALGWKAIIIGSSLILFTCAFGQRRSSLTQKVLAVVGLLLLAISINPFNTARFMLFNAWFPVLMIALRGRIKPIHLHLIFIISILFIMPILDYTSRQGKDLTESIEMFRRNMDDSLNNPFSDVFYMTVAVVWWFENTAFYYGQKTLGLLLFLIPRSFWESKATLTGLDIGGYFYELRFSGTSNLSFFIGGDFYADLGLPGVLLGAALTSYIVYWAVYKRTILLNGYNIKLLLFIGALPILVRGPVGATVGLVFFELLFVSLLFRLLPNRAKIPQRAFSLPRHGQAVSTPAPLKNSIGPQPRH